MDNEQVNGVVQFATGMAVLGLVSSMVGGMARMMAGSSSGRSSAYLPAGAPTEVTVICPICGKVIEVPQSASRSEALRRHIEQEHRSEYLSKLPQTAEEIALLDPKRFPKRTEALKKLKGYEVVEVHDDGDLTVRSQGKLYVVTTEGQVFEQKEWSSFQTEEGSEHHSMWMTPEQRKRLESKWGGMATRFAEEMVRPGDIEAAESVAETMYKRYSEAFGI